MVAGGGYEKTRQKFQATPYQRVRIPRGLYVLGLHPRMLGRGKFIKEPTLTDEQQRLLELAYELGLFGDSMEVAVKEVASILGISPSATVRRLRRALKKW
ncbi:helix-turn-helix domain-containing protein [Pyrobaculum sp.]|uniref:helix-turn-helix domain-containing protein n=1 Tax=Pyrobaculum sp. TaxID=2004705 RepID=UPI003175E635